MTMYSEFRQGDSSVKLPKISDLKKIDDAKRLHLEVLEASIGDAFLATQLAAREDGLNSEEFTACGIVVALAAVARQLAVISEDREIELAPEMFADVAREALAWAKNRDSERSAAPVH